MQANDENVIEKAFNKWDRVRHKREYDDLKKFTDAYCEKAGMSQGSVVRSLYKYDIEMRKEAFKAGWNILHKETKTQANKKLIKKVRKE